MNPESLTGYHYGNEAKRSHYGAFRNSLSTLNNPYYEELASSDLSESRKSCSDRFIPSRKYIKGM